MILCMASPALLTPAALYLRTAAACVQNFGKTLENYFIPGLIVLGVICGGIAAKTYNEGATTYVKT